MITFADIILLAASVRLIEDLTHGVLRCLTLNIFFSNSIKTDVVKSEMNITLKAVDGFKFCF